MNPDPLSLVYAALWNLAKNSAAFMSLVRLGNMIQFNDPTYQDPEKSEASDGDLPEVLLVATQMTGNLHNTSSTSDMTVTFEWWVSTGDVSVTRAILPLLWAIYCAMANWKLAVATVQWNDKPIVKRGNMGQATLGLTDLEKNRGIKGWSSIWSIELLLMFDTQDLIDQSNTPMITQ